MFYSDLCSGLYRLPNLKSVNMDDDLWDRTRRRIAATMDIESGQSHLSSMFAPSSSPLVRSWGLFHLHPKRPGRALVEFSDHVLLVT